MELEKLIRNDEVTATFELTMSSKRYAKSCNWQQKWTLQNCYANNYSKTTLAICSICLNLQVFFFFFIHASFCIFFVIYTLDSSMFEQLFLFFTQTVDDSHCLNFRDIRLRKYLQQTFRSWIKSLNEKKRDCGIFYQVSRTIGSWITRTYG